MTKLTTFARVRELAPWQAACFSAALLSRLVPNYTLFAQMTEQENPDLVGNVLNLLWESLMSPKSKINFALQREKIEQIAPDINEYDMFGVYPANDACMGMVAACSLMTKEDLHGAVVVSKLSQGGVEAYLLSSGEADDTTLKEHPLMQFEIALQQGLLTLLESEKAGKATAEQAREIALQAGITNLGVALDDC